VRLWDAVQEQNRRTRSTPDAVDRRLGRRDVELAEAVEHPGNATQQRRPSHVNACDGHFVSASRHPDLAAEREVLQLRMSMLANGIEGPDIHVAAGTPLRCSVVHTVLPDLAG
jgi:hypothetical protein